jgi:hypothetical protein
MMNPTVQQGSAKIYQFPVGGRAGLSIGRPVTQSVVDAPRVSEVACGSGWYHEAAIDDAKKSGDH